MPALFSLGLDLALKEACEGLQSDELAFAFLDDIYLLVHRNRAYEMYSHFTRIIAEKTGVQAHLGKTRCWGHGDPACPSGLAVLGEEVWRGNVASADAGLVMLGSPVGSADFVQAWGTRRLA
eukprot:953139-Karenia_brevis.AAC.1